MSTRTLKILDMPCSKFWDIDPKSSPIGWQKAGMLAPFALTRSSTRKNPRRGAIIDALRESVAFLENTRRNNTAGTFKVEKVLERVCDAFGLLECSNNSEYEQDVNP